MIQQQNTSSHKIQLAWHKLSQDIPAGWTAFICDNTQCFPDLRDSSIMDSVYVGAYGFLALAINPAHISGRAIVSYEVWNTSTPGIHDTLTWIISADRMSGVNALDQPALRFSRSENQLIISGIPEKYHELKIYDLSGKLLLHHTDLNGDDSFSCEHFSHGIYYVHLNDDEGHSIFQKISL